MRWGVAVGGTTSGDAAGLMATDKDRRYITGEFTGGAGTDASDDFYEFVWADGMQMKRVASSAFFCGKVTGEHDMLWIKQPR